MSGTDLDEFDKAINRAINLGVAERKADKALGSLVQKMEELAINIATAPGAKKNKAVRSL